MTTGAGWGVEFSRRAASEVERAREWWLNHRDKAPKAFDEEMLDLVTGLERAPQIMGERARNMAGIRRAYLKRIRYYAYFRIRRDRRRVQILSLWHASRGQEPDF